MRDIPKERLHRFQSRRYQDSQLLLRSISFPSQVARKSRLRPSSDAKTFRRQDLTRNFVRKEINPLEHADVLG